MREAQSKTGGQSSLIRNAGSRLALTPARQGAQAVRWILPSREKVNAMRTGLPSWLR